MRYLVFRVLLVSCLVGSRHNNAKAQETRQHVASHADTIFILKEKTKDYYHKVYIEQNRHSVFYSYLMNFKMDKFDLEDYKANHTSLKKHFPSPLKKYNLSGLPKEWIPLYKYRGKYYVYYPSEAGNLGRKIITDSTMVYWFMDGPLPEPILFGKRINENVWYLNINSYFENRPNAKLTIHIIDPKNKIAVWEDSSQRKADRYELYIPKECAKNFDMIVNSCDQNKVDEFIFDEIDYSALLKSH